MSKNVSHLSGRDGKELEFNLFEHYGIKAKESGTVDKTESEELAEQFLIGDANTFGATSFYDFLKEENKGKVAYVCNGSACLCAGTQDGVKEELSKHLKPEQIGHMTCLGRCHENGAFHYEGKNYSAKSSEEIADIIQKKDKREDAYIVGSNCSDPILTREFPGIDAYYGLLEDWLSKGRDAVLAEIKDSGLRGRGGAGFPMGVKLEFCKNSEADQKFIVCNADEGDPGAYSDRYLLELQPHSVLFGMMAAGFVIGADKGVLYIRAEYPESVEVIEKAVQELHAAGWLGDNIKGSGFNFNFKVIKAAGAYICGEETALLSSIEGQRPEVRVRPPFPAQEGLFRKPTIVNNVETLASVHYILSKGGEHFQGIGRGRSTGTKLVCLDSFFNKPGLYEIEMGTPMTEILDMAGGFKEDVKAIQVGGPLGGIVPTTHLDKLTLDFESFSENGFLLGHAGVVSIPKDFPMVQYLEHLFEFTSVESCGKCFPCRLGSRRGWEMLEKARVEGYKIDRQLMDDLLEALEDGSLCALGGGLPLGIKNALEHFQEELSPYFIEAVTA
jgi:NADH:ubiquinone oxidoreductase subunit F (NADH-binding)/NADH:ubiquinone oxidoreductase subunit E